MIKKDYLEKLRDKKKPFIIYKSAKGFDLYTDFSKKIILNNGNIKKFLNKIDKKKGKKKIDLFIGFFGYEILNNLIGVKLSKQKGLKFPKGIFYKPETKVNLNNKLIYKNKKKNKLNNEFKININQKKYNRIFNNFKKKIQQGLTYQIKVCTKYRNKSKIDPIDFFCRLSKTNLAPKAFLIKDKNFSIIS